MKQGSRGLASSPLLRVVAEQRPPSGFAEQAVRGACLGPAGPGIGEISGSSGSVTSQLVASLLDSLAELDASLSSNSSSEVINLSVQEVGRQYSSFPACWSHHATLA